MKKQTIVRSDGIVYERKAKEHVCDYRINVRMYKTTVDKLKSIAESKNTKYQSLIREILEEYCKEYEEK